MLCSQPDVHQEEETPECFRVAAMFRTEQTAPAVLLKCSRLLKMELFHKDLLLQWERWRLRLSSGCAMGSEPHWIYIPRTEHGTDRHPTEYQVLEEPNRNNRLSRTAKGRFALPESSFPNTVIHTELEKHFTFGKKQKRCFPF